MTVLPLQSSAVIFMLKEVPVVCALILSKTKWSRAPAFTANELLVPVTALSVAVMVTLEPTPVTVTWPDHTPFTKAGVTVGLIVPVETRQSRSASVAGYWIA